MRVRASALAALALCALEVSRGAAQQVAGCSAGRRRVVAATVLGGEAAVIALRQADWWSSRPRSFHVIWGGSPAAGQNDLLHAAISYQVAQVAARAWDWACVSRTGAGWLGAATALAVGLTKELGDGLHAEGFSGSTLLIESAAATLPALHRQWPATAVLQLKALYWPSSEYRHRTGPLPSLENDYAGQRFYLTLNPARRPGGAGAWPRWLGVALGHGTPTWISQPPSHVWYATLDVDLSGIPVHASWWPVVATLLDQVHFPAPGIRIAAGRVEAGLF